MVCRKESTRNTVVEELEKVDDMGQIRLFQKQEELKEKVPSAAHPAATGGLRRHAGP